jgi:NADH dehydrogenase (ubiquinone) 1 beta subcomplex subunit 8
MFFQMHEHEEMYSMWGPDIPHVDPATALRHFAIAVSGFVAFGLLCNYALVPERPAVPRQYPFDGLVKELGGLEANKVSISSPLRSSSCNFVPPVSCVPCRPT